MNEKVKSSIQNLHQRIKEIRISKGLTQAQLAEKMDIALRGYQHWEGGKKDFRVGTLFRLAQVLGCNPTDFFKKPTTISAGPGRPTKKRQSKKRNKS